MVLIFTVTLFVSSVLLFLVQPMVGKMILPSLGGTPAVWNTCMVFFQAALLAGYAYAHATVNWLGVRRQAVLHAVVLLVPLAVLPIIVGHDAVPPAESNPAFWLLGQLALCVGLPFFVVSTSAPLLQRWFSKTGHASAQDPYFLYAASNFGSFLALLAYPLLFEPTFNLTEQSRVWMFGYCLLIVLVWSCAIVLWRSRSAAAGASDAATSTNGPAADAPTARRRLRWVLLALTPSSLLLGVTTHVTTDLAPVPLLWVVPLALYLLTFVLVFARRPPLSHRVVVGVFPYVIVLAGIMAVLGELPPVPDALFIPLHLLAFFLAAMLCHGELVRSRPPARHLTEFYLWVSVGGVLGGLLNAVLAPMVFNILVEYPLMMVAACLAMPARRTLVSALRHRILDVGLPIFVGLVTLGTAVGVYAVWVKPHAAVLALAVLIVPAALCVTLKSRPRRLALGLGAVLVASNLGVASSWDKTLYVGRNFYGTKRVVETDGGAVRKFLHGHIIHGMQSARPPGDREPLAYFHRHGPLGDVFRALSGPRAKARVAIVGEGVGSMIAYALPGQHFTFYEIDPQVHQIAEDVKLFTYLGQHRGAYDVVLGDGRLTLAGAPDRHYGMIVLDVFNSDALPVHLFTREALRMYASKLEDGGVLVFHITNRYVNLRRLLGNLAADTRLVCYARDDMGITAEDEKRGRLGSHYLVMARRPGDLGEITRLPQWEPVFLDPSAPLWTDQFSNLLSAFGG